PILPRWDRNTMRSPLGDQKGTALPEASVVSRRSFLRSRSRSQISRLAAANPRENATVFSSGEIAGIKRLLGVPRVSRIFPPRSNQTISLTAPPPPPVPP